MLKLTQIGGLALLALALFLSSNDACAHRLKHVFSTVELNASNRLEVSHQVHYHDASTALSLIQNMRETDVLDLEGQARLLLHLQDQFAITIDGETVPLEVVGAEVEGNHIFFYFESSVIETPTAISVRNGMMMDLFADQQNLMNVRVGDKLKSLRFEKPEEIKTAHFD